MTSTIPNLSEEDFHILVASYLSLSLHDDVVWTTIETSNQQGGPKGRAKQIKLKRKGVMSGFPDIILLWRKKDSLHCICIELKTKTGKLSKIQKIVHKLLNSIGIPTAVVRDLHQLATTLSIHNVPHNKIRTF